MNIIAEQLLGSIEWVDENSGYCQCPGEHLHNGKNGARDCQVFLEGAPTIHCFHDSCATPVAQANYELRRAIGREEMSTSAQVEVRRNVNTLPKQFGRVSRKLKETPVPQGLLERVVQQRWHPSDMWEDSPDKLLDDCTNDWRKVLALFEPDDVVWIGAITDSGGANGGKHFKAQKEWLRGSVCPGAFTCPSTFKVGTESRSGASVAQRRYLVVESDLLKKDEIGAVFRWLNKYLTLWAVVDTGGKSLHGWFSYPKKNIPMLKELLGQLRCDTKMFGASQPCRMPSARRGKGWQSLVFYAPEGYARS